MGRALIPRPRTLVEGEGAVTWTRDLRVAVDVELLEAAETFANDLAHALGWSIEIAGGDVDLMVRLNTSLAPAAYRIAVDDVTTVVAGGPAGAAHALTTLRQLLPDAAWGSGANVASVDVARVTIADEPQFSWRGVHLDVSRHFFDVDDVKRLIDLAAAHRLNVLHLHLNDDQGWRVEVPGWPGLTEVGSRRRSTPVGHEVDGVDDDLPYGGFYTAADLLSIREHAARRHVTVVPEIDLPGHAQAALAAYPELGNTGVQPEVWTRWGVSEHVLAPTSAATAFAVEVTRYVASLFPGSPVHIGGDECPTTEWEASDDAREVMRSRSFTSARQLQGLFTSAVAAALAADGHEVVAWDEVLDATVLEGTVIAAWRGSAKGVEAARRGLDVVMCAQDYLYFDWLNSDDEDEPVAQNPAPFSTPWEKVYEFSVVPPDLEPALAHYVRGCQAQLWSEYIATRDHLDYMAFPRLVAFAEVAWGTATNATEFRGRLVEHLARLDAMGVRYRPLD